MGARRALIVLMIAFGISATVAAVTTIRQVHIAGSSSSRAVTGI